MRDWQGLYSSANSGHHTWPPLVCRPCSALSVCLILVRGSRLPVMFIRVKNGWDASRGQYTGWNMGCAQLPVLRAPNAHKYSQWPALQALHACMRMCNMWLQGPMLWHQPADNPEQHPCSVGDALPGRPRHRPSTGQRVPHPWGPHQLRRADRSCVNSRMSMACMAAVCCQMQCAAISMLKLAAASCCLTERRYMWGLWYFHCVSTTPAPSGMAMQLHWLYPRGVTVHTAQ